MVSPATQSVAMLLFFPTLRPSEFSASATESPIELMLPDNLTIAVKIHKSSEYEKLRCFFFFLKSS